jgi:hypothetical protein
MHMQTHFGVASLLRGICVLLLHRLLEAFCVLHIAMCDAFCILDLAVGNSLRLSPMVDPFFHDPFSIF